jgi:hypothetical protein
MMAVLVDKRRGELNPTTPKKTWSSFIKYLFLFPTV